MASSDDRFEYKSMIENGRSLAEIVFVMKYKKEDVFNKFCDNVANECLLDALEVLFIKNQPIFRKILYYPDFLVKQFTPKLYEEYEKRVMKYITSRYKCELLVEIEQQHENYRKKMPDGTLKPLVFSIIIKHNYKLKC